MGRSDVIRQLKEQGLIVVVRGEDKTEGLKASIACIEGGITAVEVAFTNPEAGQIIKELSKNYKDDAAVLIGAGTVLDPYTARQAILEGARYVVSPAFNEEVAKVCNLYTIPYIPGCMTLTEITRALEASCEMIKLFPGSVFEPSYLSAIKAPIPQVSVMVTGGVNLTNVQTWFNAGADALGIGGEFNKLASQGDFDTIREKAKDYVALR